MASITYKNKSILCPVLNLVISEHNNVCRLNFLLDTGAQENILNLNKFPEKGKNVPLTKEFQMFKRNITLACRESYLDVMFPDGSKQNLPFTLVDQFSMKYKIPGLRKRYEALRDKLSFSVNFSAMVNGMSKDTVAIDGILGIDAISRFTVFENIKLSEGKFIRLANGLLPIGSVATNDAPLISVVKVAAKAESSSPLLGKCPKTDMIEVGKAMNIMYKDRTELDQMPDFETSYLDNKFSIANNYGEDVVEETFEASFAK